MVAVLDVVKLSLSRSLYLSLSIYLSLNARVRFLVLLLHSLHGEGF